MNAISWLNSRTAVGGFTSRIPLKGELRRWVVRLRHVRIGADDVFISSYPRSGSTWLRFLLFDLLMDEEATFRSVNRYLPYVGQHRQAPELLPGGGRLIKTHECYGRQVRKTIYLVRDVRSVVLSEYRFARYRQQYSSTLDAFLTDFIRGTVNPFGSWRDHVEFWLHHGSQHRESFLLLRFEDMREDAGTTLKKAARFLELKPDDEAIERAIRNNDVREMRKKDARAIERIDETKIDRKYGFIGEGATKAWREALTNEQVRRLEDWAGILLPRLGYQVEH